MYERLSIKIYANLYEITHKFIKKYGAPTKDERAHSLIKTRAKASTCIAREELVQSKLYIEKYIIFRKLQILSNFIKFVNL